MIFNKKQKNQLIINKSVIPYTVMGVDDWIKYNGVFVTKLHTFIDKIQIMIALNGGEPSTIHTIWQNVFLTAPQNLNHETTFKAIEQSISTADVMLKMNSLYLELRMMLPEMFLFNIKHLFYRTLSIDFGINIEHINKIDASFKWFFILPILSDIWWRRVFESKIS